MTQRHLLAVTKFLHPAVSSEHRSHHLTATCCLPGVSSGPLSRHTQLPCPFATAMPSPHLDIVPKYSLVPKHLRAWKSQWTPPVIPGSLGFSHQHSLHVPTGVHFSPKAIRESVLLSAALIPCLFCPTTTSPHQLNRTAHFREKGKGSEHTKLVLLLNRQDSNSFFYSRKQPHISGGGRGRRCPFPGTAQGAVASGGTSSLRARCITAACSPP